MNAATRERLAKRLDAIEARHPTAPLPTVEWHVVVPSPDGPRRTGEVIRWNHETGRRELVNHAPE